MIDFFSTVLSKTDNIAILVLLLALASCAVLHVFEYKARAKRDAAIAKERAAFNDLIRQNTEAINALRSTLSALSGHIF